MKLLQYKTVFVKVRDEYGKSALMHVALKGHTHCIEILKEEIWM